MEKGIYSGIQVEQERKDPAENEAPSMFSPPSFFRQQSPDQKASPNDPTRKQSNLNFFHFSIGQPLFSPINPRKHSLLYSCEMKMSLRKNSGLFSPCDAANHIKEEYSSPKICPHLLDQASCFTCAARGKKQEEEAVPYYNTKIREEDFGLLNEVAHNIVKVEPEEKKIEKPIEDLNSTRLRKRTVPKGPIKDTREKKAKKSKVKKCEQDKKKIRPYPCKCCKMSFAKAQGLGGHMSRKHPGKSTDYNYKKSVRKNREVERVKLLIAKKRFFHSIGRDYDSMVISEEGKKMARVLINRSKVKRLKKKLTKDEINSFVDANLLQSIVQGKDSI